MTVSAKTDVELLMNEWISFGKNMLAEHGEFYPYAAALTAEREIVSFAADDGSEHPSSADIISFLKAGLRDRASRNTYIATALFFDVKIDDSNSPGMTDAIAVALDHRSDYSVTVFFPYKLQDGLPSFGDLFATQGSADIFTN